jgi:hypothetical protein
MQRLGIIPDMIWPIGMCKPHYGNHYFSPLANGANGVYFKLRKIHFQMEILQLHTGSGLEVDWKRTGSRLEADWKQTGSRLVADWKQT